MGHSRGGLTAKIHALPDAAGLPIALKLTEGEAHAGRSAQDMLEQMQAGQILLAGRAYDSDALRQALAERGAFTNVKPMPNLKNIPAFSAFLYRERNLVERFFNNSPPTFPTSEACRNLKPASLKHFRAPQQHTTSGRKTTSPASNSLQQEFGCGLMSR